MLIQKFSDVASQQIKTSLFLIFCLFSWIKFTWFHKSIKQNNDHHEQTYWLAKSLLNFFLILDFFESKFFSLVRCFSRRTVYSSAVSLCKEYVCSSPWSAFLKMSGCSVIQVDTVLRQILFNICLSQNNLSFIFASWILDSATGCPTKHDNWWIV